MTPELSQIFIHLDAQTIAEIIVIGFIGGTLSGFIGSGGAFFMTPGMMNLGVPGIVAVGSNITHKFGKAMMGSKKHGDMGNVDRKLGIFLIFTSFLGIRLAVWINTTLFEGGGGSHGEGGGSAGSDLYISAIFIVVLSVVALSMLRDSLKSRHVQSSPSRRISEFLSRFRLDPLIYFPVSDVRISLWVILLVGLATGYLAGTIGVGGFIGVPAMIYVFGIPTTVATGTELFLAMFMGAFGALNYAFMGYVDLRITLLLFLGSLVGIYLGAYGTKVVRESMIRMVTSVLILLCVLSRAITVPLYLHDLGVIELNPALRPYCEQGSKGVLFLAGISGCLIILVAVFRQYVRRRRTVSRLKVTNQEEAAS